MASVKFLHCADIHLDSPFTSLGVNSDLRDIRRKDLREVFERIISVAKDEKVKLLLISGDLFEHDYVSKSTIGFLDEKFREISEIYVIVVPGNHDPYTVSSYYRNFKWSNNVYILSDDSKYVKFDDLKVTVYGVGFKSFYQETAEIKELKLSDPDSINLLLMHGTVDMNFGNNRYNPIESKSLGSLGMDYIALGHFHRRMDDVGGMGLIYNPGSPEPMGFDEPGYHGVYIVSIEKPDIFNKKTETRFIETGKRVYRKVEIDLTGCEDEISVLSKISGEAAGLGSSESLVHITLKGYLGGTLTIDTGKINAFLSDKFLYVKVTDETEEGIDISEVMKDAGIRGLFARKMAGMIENEESEYKKRLLRKAFIYGIEALEKGSVEVK